MFKFLKTLFRRVKNPQRFVSLSNGNINMAINISNSTDEREEVKAIEIIHMFETEENFSVEDLNDKINEINERINFHNDITKNGIPSELTHALEILKARKKYSRTFHLFNWKTTSEEKIEELCTRYKLNHRILSDYLYNIPKEAMKECKNFDKALKKVTKEKSQFSIIAPPEFFRDQRKDPILLARSPFGNFYYILCAWDKEVDVVHELLFGETIKTN